MKKRDKIIIIGAGRSLEEIFPILKSLENNFIIKAIYDDNKKYKYWYPYGIKMPGLKPQIYFCDWLL